MEEIFKTIQQFPDYEISNCGRLRTKERMVRYTHSVTNNEHFRKTEGRFLKVHFNNNTGYKFCQLYKNKKMYNKTIHRLVAEAFIVNNLKLPIVNHIDGNKHNNTVENLEWCTDAYNHKHATETGLLAKGSEIASSRLNEKCVYAIKYFLNNGYSHIELSKIFKVARSTISLISEGVTWKHIILTGTELTLTEKPTNHD